MRRRQSSAAGHLRRLLGTELIYYGGTAIDVALAVTFTTQWYLATGRAPARARREQPSPDRDAEVAMGPPLAEAEYQRVGASVPGLGVGAQENAAMREGQPGKTQEDDVSEFDDLEKKAEAYAEEHPDQADKGINEVTGFAEHDTDHQHDEQIDRAVDAAERHTGQGQDRQGNQD
jgi:hypothetical protein